MIELFLQLLNAEDDSALWRVAIEHIFTGLERIPGTIVEIGRCSHWLRPHQTRWTADGGFAWPTGYGGGTQSRDGLPQFDWSVALAWTGERWEVVNPKTAKGRALNFSLRITIPSRTTRHAQAAVHTLWMSDRDAERRFYGFRRKDGAWVCTAESDSAEDRRSAK